MNLEDRIKHTGEHVLGSFEPEPDLQARIADRVEHRAQQRRQRAAAGLSAGVVVVLGGLVVLNVSGRPSDAPTESASSRPSITTLMATTTAALTVPTTASRPAARPSTTSAATPPEPTPPAPDPTEFAPIAPDAPVLLTAETGGSVMTALELSSGQAVTMAFDGTREGEPGRAASASEAYEYVTAPIPVDQQDLRCGIESLTVLQAGASVETPLPSAISRFLLSDDGSTGVIQYVSCHEIDPPEGGHWAAFAADDPAAALIPLPVPSVEEISSDGRYVAYQENNVSRVVDVATGTPVETVPANCTVTRADPTYGYLYGPDGFAALALCDGEVSLLTGKVGAVSSSMAFAQCGDNAELTAWSGSDPDRSVAWFAVTDPDARLTWVVGPSGVFGPVQVLDRVWWQARSPDPSS